mmetsp:Transcript_23788/g.37386  ORF Transcript_23788/g.37386 Transcript_23788/m.37386 type:complete len:89 (+) Transcript_23788:2-268(+)
MEILANVLNVPVQAIEDSQGIGAFGAYMLARRCLGITQTLDLKDVKIRARVYRPQSALKRLHDKRYSVYSKMHVVLKDTFGNLADGLQ